MCQSKRKATEDALIHMLACRIDKTQSGVFKVHTAFILRDSFFIPYAPLKQIFNQLYTQKIYRSPKAALFTSSLRCLVVPSVCLTWEKSIVASVHSTRASQRPDCKSFVLLLTFSRVEYLRHSKVSTSVFILNVLEPYFILLSSMLVCTCVCSRACT